MKYSSTNFLPKSRKGSGMVEVLVATGIMGAVLVSIIGVYHSLASISILNTEKIQANFLMEEGVEAVRVIRDGAWSNIASTTPGVAYHLRFQGGTWTATTTPQAIDIFTRTVVFSTVNRDADFNILTSGGTNDSGTRKAQITVSWKEKNATTTRSIETYLFNTFGN